MSEENNTLAGQEKPLDLATAQSTYKIITALIEQVEASSNLIALLASSLGEKATFSVTQTSTWAAYLSSKRTLETLTPELHRFVSAVTQLTEEQEEKPK